MYNVFKKASSRGSAQIQIHAFKKFLEGQIYNVCAYSGD